MPEIGQNQVFRGEGFPFRHTRRKTMETIHIRKNDNKK